MPIRPRHSGTALHDAAARGDVETLRMLVDAGSDIDAPDRTRRAPLMYAPQEGHTDCVRLLLQRGADVCKSDLGGPTSVNHTARHNDVEKLRMLLASAAGPVALDPLLHATFVVSSVSQAFFSFALACGCCLEMPSRAIEVPQLSAVLPIICYYFSYRL